MSTLTKIFRDAIAIDTITVAERGNFEITDDLTGIEEIVQLFCPCFFIQGRKCEDFLREQGVIEDFKVAVSRSAKPNAPGDTMITQNHDLATTRLRRKAFFLHCQGPLLCRAVRTTRRWILQRSLRCDYSISFEIHIFPLRNEIS